MKAAFSYQKSLSDFKQKKKKKEEENFNFTKTQARFWMIKDKTWMKGMYDEFRTREKIRLKIIVANPVETEGNFKEKRRPLKTKSLQGKKVQASLK